MGAFQVADYNKEFDSDINFPKLLFLHINRIMQSINEPTAYISAIEALEDVLTPYIEDSSDYETEVKKEEKTVEEANQEDGLKKDKGAKMLEAKVNLARSKFRGLMRIAEKKGLLLEKVGVGYDTPDEGSV